MSKNNQENKNIEEAKQSKILSLLSFSKDRRVPMILFIAVVILFGAPVITYGFMTLRARIVVSIQEKNDKLEQAIEANDYDAWQEAVSDRSLREKITRENFSDYVLSYKMLKQGDIDGANAIKRSLGMKGSFSQVSTKSQSLEDSINSLNYNAWRGMVGNNMPQINQDNFAEYAKAYQSASSGDISKASGLLRGLNLKTKDFSSSR